MASSKVGFLTDEEMAELEKSGRAVAPKAPKSGFISDDEMMQLESQEKEKPSEVESAARGFAQGASFGFADEISGGVESLIGDKTYKQARNESRENFKKAQEANPGSFVAG